MPITFGSGVNLGAGVQAGDILPVKAGLQVYWDADVVASYVRSGINITNLISASNPHIFGPTVNVGGGAVFTNLDGINCWDCTNAAGASIKPTTYQQAYSLLPSTYTYCVWARLKSGTTDYRTLIRSVPNDHLLLLNTGAYTLGYYDNDTASFYSTGYNAASLVNVWAQWTVTSSGTGNSTYYINGAQAGVAVSFGGGGNYHDSVGSLGSGQPFGHVSNCMLYNRVLSLSEIKQNYESFRIRHRV